MPQGRDEWLKTIMYIAIIFALAWFGANQFQGYINKAELLMHPCDLCLELNENLEPCFDQFTSTPSGSVGVVSDFDLT